MKKYHVTLSYDMGTVVLEVSARNIIDAIKICTTAENAPVNAVIKVALKKAKR